MQNTTSNTLEDFQSSFHGNIILPNHTGYDEARKIWNGMFDKKPSIIAQCADKHDVVSCVNFARENNLLLSVKGGGHNSAGMATNNDGMVLDLGNMNQVTVNETNKTVRVQGGALLSDVDRETQKYGLAVSAGIVSHTGVGGLTLGGGFGWISRKFGMSVDNLISAEIVTANGRLIMASANENPNIFWAIRGGGGNFGVVTDFTFQAAEIGTEVYAGLIIKPFDNAKEYLRFQADYVRNMPDDMTIWMVIRHAPPLPFLDEEHHWKMVVIVPFIYLGNQEEGEKLIKPIVEWGNNYATHIGKMPWVDWQGLFDGLVTHGARNYWKSHQMLNLSDDCLDQILKYASILPSKECEIFIPHLEGKAGRVPENETAFAHRTAPFVMNIHTRWQDASDDERCIQWARDIHDATRPFSKGVYVNFLSDEGQDRVREAYTKEVWDRLVEIKRQWDPENLFRMNQNIKP